MLLDEMVKSGVEAVLVKVSSIGERHIAVEILLPTFSSLFGFFARLGSRSSLGQVTWGLAAPVS